MKDMVILGLGSNKGDSQAILSAAIDALRGVLSGLRAASLYRTRPMHIEDQPYFFNTACAGNYAGPPEQLLEDIHQIEIRFGRDRERELRWGQRSLDIDILLAGGLALHEQHLTIPHARLVERRFALEPLLELEPRATLPSGEKLSDILNALPEQGVEKLP